MLEVIQQNQINGQKKSEQYAFVLRNLLISEKNLKKEFSQYSIQNEELYFLLDQQIIDYSIRHKSLDFPIELEQNIELFELKINIKVMRRSENLQLSLDSNSIALLDLYEYLTESHMFSRKPKSAAFIHQWSGAFYEFNNFSTLLCHIPCFENDSSLTYLDDELVNKFKVYIYSELQPQQNQQLQTQQFQETQIQTGITINIFLEKGPLITYFKLIDISANLSFFELNQLVGKYLGYNNPEIVEIDLFRSDGFQLNCGKKQSRIQDLNVENNYITFIAKFRETQRFQYINIQKGITINIKSLDGPFIKKFSFINMCADLSVFELKQLVCIQDIIIKILWIQICSRPTGYYQGVTHQKIKFYQILSNFNISRENITILTQTKWIRG